MFKIITFLVASSAFQAGGEIPAKYTCEGKDISPPITWQEVPKNAKSIALIMNDPDAFDPDDPESSRYVHWILYNIPATNEGLPEGIASKNLPAGTLQGLNGWDKTGYGGPCPPSGTHRYFFNVYALDTVLPDLKEPSEGELQKAMQGHIVGTGEIIGTYQRAKK